MEWKCSQWACSDTFAVSQTAASVSVPLRSTFVVWCTNLSTGSAVTSSKSRTEVHDWGQHLTASASSPSFFFLFHCCFFFFFHRELQTQKNKDSKRQADSRDFYHTQTKHTPLC